MQKQKLEFIISYTVNGDDFEYNDNHGVLIRCKDCKYYSARNKRCSLFYGEWIENDYCSKAVKREL